MTRRLCMLLYVRLYARQPTDDFSRVEVSVTRGIRCKSVITHLHQSAKGDCGRLAATVDHESRSRTMALRNACNRPTYTAVPADFDFRLSRSLHFDAITEFD